MLTIAYQTLEDRGNPEHVEEFGPFLCQRSDAWLGYGYYFWDTHIELAHWWGRNSYLQGYMICKCRCNIDHTCWDLVGNGEHRLELHDICDELLRIGVTTKERILLPRVIEYLKKKGIFEYEAIRAAGINVNSIPYRDAKVVHRLKFVPGNQAFVDLYPPVQICLLKKTALSLCKFKVIFPEEYIEHYA